MDFKTTLIEGRLIKRYKRFMADVEITSTKETVTIHCPNTGSMMGLLTPQSPVWMSESFNPKRALKYTWEIASDEDTMVGVNTQVPNMLVAEGLSQGFFPPFSGQTTFIREIKVGDSRLDFLLPPAQEHPACYLEVKNVHTRLGHQAAFPDAVTTRGAKHLRSLMDLRAQGYRAAMVYIIQRTDLKEFTIAQSIDPDYAHEVKNARQAGVEFYAYSAKVSLNGIYLHEAVPFCF